MRSFIDRVCGRADTRRPVVLEMPLSETDAMVADALELEGWKEREPGVWHPDPGSSS